MHFFTVKKYKGTIRLFFRHFIIRDVELSSFSFSDDKTQLHTRYIANKWNHINRCTKAHDVLKKLQEVSQMVSRRQLLMVVYSPSPFPMHISIQPLFRNFNRVCCFKGIFIQLILFINFRVCKLVFSLFGSWT